MATLSIKGDLDGVSDKQLEFIRTVIEKDHYNGSSVTFEPVGKAGDNYAASVKRITIEGDTDKMTIVGKMAPENEIVRNYMSSGALFRNEHIMYSEFLPKLLQLQIDAGIPKEEQLKYAKCFGTYMQGPHEVILLEDLKPLNFIMLDRFQSLSNECVKLVLKNFAVYHSLSYVLKRRDPESYNYVKANITDIWSTICDREDFQGMMQGIEAGILSVLEEEDHINLMKPIIANIFQDLSKLSKHDYDSKYFVCVQGDAWTNNIMFKLENDHALESIMIDYQLSRISRPVFDLMYMIFNCTNYATRKQHYHDWIEYYHAELEISLLKFNLKVDDVYPRDQLDADLKRYGTVMLGFCVFVAIILMRDTDDAKKFMEDIKSENVEDQTNALNVSQLDEKSIIRVRHKIVGLIQSFKEFELL